MNRRLPAADTSRHRYAGAGPLAAAVLAAFLGCGAVAAADSDPAAAARYYEQGRSLFDQDDLETAIIQLKNATAEDPTLVSAHVLLAEAYIRQGNGITAEYELRLAQEHGADRALVVPLLAQAYLQQFKYVELLQELKADGLPPDARTEVLLNRAQAHLEFGELERADQTFIEAAALLPDNPRPIIGRAMAAMRRGDLEAAMTLIDGAIALDAKAAEALNVKASVLHVQGRLEDALATYAQVLEIEPAHREARIARVGLLLDLGRDRETTQDLVYLADRYPNDPRAAYLRAMKLTRAGDAAGARSHLAEAAVELDSYRATLMNGNQQLLMLAGVVNYSLGQFQAAAEYLERYVQRFPSGVGARKLLGAILVARKEIDKALNVLIPAQASAPQDPQLLSLLAGAWMAKGRHDKAATLLEEAAKLPGADAQVRTQLAHSRLTRGDVEGALQVLDEVLERDPRSENAAMLLATVQLRRRNYDEAMAVARGLLAQDPDNLTLLNLVATAQAGKGERDLARRGYAAVLEKDPQFAPARINLAKLDLQERNYDGARERLQAVLKDNPTDQQAFIELARVEQRAGNLRAAIEWLEKARVADTQAIPSRLLLVDLLLQANELERALRAAEEASSRAPEDLTALEMLARVQITRGDKELARVTARRMADVAAFEPRWLQRAAELLFRVGAIGDARYTLDKAIQGDPEFLPARIARTELYLRDGELEEAAKAVAHIREHWPDSAVGPRLAGDLALQRGDTARAVEHYREAFAGDRSTSAIVRLARALVAAGRAEAAVDELRTWTGSHPDDLAVRHALAESLAANGNRDGARLEYEIIVEQTPKDVRALNNLAWLYESAGDPRSEEIARRAHALAGNDGDVQDTLGWILVRRGKAQEGLRHLRDARARNAQSYSIRLHIAQALDALGRPDEARKEIEALLAVETEFEGVEEARALQRKLAN